MSNRRSAVVSFVAPADNGGAAITGYKVISSPPGGEDGDAGSPGLSHTVTGLRSELEYTFTVVAMNAAGEGAASAPSNVVTPGTAGDRR